MKKVLISGKNFEKFPKKEVYFTDGYYKKVNETKIKTGGSYLSLIANGRGVRGFKHLLEKIYDTDSDARVIFTNDNTRKEGHDWYINLDEYKKAVSEKFFALYRETGLDGALCYLSQKLPEYFSYNKAHLSEKDYKKITKNLPEILSRVKSKKDKDAVVNQSLSIIKELGKKNKNRN